MSNLTGIGQGPGLHAGPVCMSGAGRSLALGYTQGPGLQAGPVCMSGACRSLALGYTACTCMSLALSSPFLAQGYTARKSHRGYVSLALTTGMSLA